MSPPISPYEDGGAGALPTVVIVHGGFFKDKWSARNTQTASLVPFLLERGLAVGLVEYRRRGGVDAERPPLFRNHYFDQHIILLFLHYHHCYDCY